jgi:hypothetical protein
MLSIGCQEADVDWQCTAKLGLCEGCILIVHPVVSFGKIV